MNLSLDLRSGTSRNGLEGLSSAASHPLSNVTDEKWGVEV